MEYSEYMDALRQAAEPEYAAFQRKIVSDTAYPILGVRMPTLRKTAKAIAKADLRSFLSAAEFASYEEAMLCGLAIAYSAVPTAEKLDLLWKWLPKVDSWALTDSVVPTLDIRPEDRQQLWNLALRCLEGREVYTVRFGVVILLHVFLTPEHIPAVAQLLQALQDDRYYVQMAAAWCLAEMAVTDPKTVEAILKSGRLDRFTHNKTIQKMCDSYRITKEQKAAARLLRRK